MRFDATRALGWYERLASTGVAGTEGERRAAEVVAEDLARLGLTVERAEVRDMGPGAWARAAPVWLGVGLSGVVLAVEVARVSPRPAVIAAAAVAVAWARLFLVEGGRSGDARPRRDSSTNVIARRDGAGTPAAEPPVRVVFHTPLGATELAQALRPTRPGTPALGVLLAVLALAALAVPRGRSGWGSWLILGALYLFVLELLLRVARRQKGRVESRDSRDGLAALLEMARSWPGSLDARVEVRFAATGGGGAGLRALARALDAERPGKPTMFVGLLAPGVGPGVLLAERGTGRLAETAAADLWIPHRVARRGRARRALCPPGRRGPASVAIVGDAAGRPGPAPPVEPEALARAAQLAAEVALRWARSNRRATTRGD